MQNRFFYLNAKSILDAVCDKITSKTTDQCRNNFMNDSLIDEKIYCKINFLIDSKIDFLINCKIVHEIVYEFLL